MELRIRVQLFTQVDGIPIFVQNSGKRCGYYTYYALVGAGCGSMVMVWLRRIPSRHRVMLAFRAERTN